MKTTLIRPDGTRLVIEPSLNFANVRMYVLGEAEIITIPVCLAGVVAQAIEAAATLIEESCQPDLADLPGHALVETSRRVLL